jgi:hypothetical protein
MADFQKLVAAATSELWRGKGELEATAPTVERNRTSVVPNLVMCPSNKYCALRNNPQLLCTA